jgi:ParB-like chromosome segregation protein Spo0J
MSKREIIYKRLEEIKPFEKNPKIHTEEQVDKICESINRFGFINPIVIDSNGIIIAGHGRSLAAQKLKLKEVPTIQVDNLSQKEIDTFRVFDNRSNELSSWDEAKLSEALKDLDSALLSLTGFSDSEISRYKNPYNFEDVVQEMSKLEDEKKEEMDWKARIEKADFEKIKGKIEEVKMKIDVSRFYSDYANGKALLQLIEDVLAGFKKPTDVDGYFADLEIKSSVENGKNLIKLVEANKDAEDIIG